MKTVQLSRLGKALSRLRRIKIPLSKHQDISVAELNAMLLLLNNQQDGTDNVYASDMAEALNTSKAAMSQMMSSLEERGFIQRSFNQNNRRKIMLMLTDKGRVTVEEAEQEFLAVMRQVADGLGEGKAHQLTILLEECDSLLQAIGKEQ